MRKNYKHSPETRKKLSKSLKKYYKNLTKEERSERYNTVKTGKDHPHYKPIGYTRDDPNGYRIVKISENKWVSEHILVAEKHLGRKLKKGEVVHHINENGLDNDPNNLYVFQKRGLHSAFTQLVKHGIIPLNILKSNIVKKD